MNEEDQLMRPGETLDGIASLLVLAIFFTLPLLSLALVLLLW